MMSPDEFDLNAHVEAAKVVEVMTECHVDMNEKQKLLLTMQCKGLYLAGCQAGIEMTKAVMHPVLFASVSK